MIEIIIIAIIVILSSIIGYYYAHKEKRAYDNVLSVGKQNTTNSEVSDEIQEDYASEIAWRSDRYKRTFSSNDVVTFYETEPKTQEIWKGYMIVQSFAVMLPHKITLIPQITYSSKLDRLLNAKEAAAFHPELTPPDRYYDSTKEEARDFIQKLKYGPVNTERYEKIVSEYIDKIKDSDSWIEMTKSTEERFE